jgi:tight adherence protein C
MILIIISILTFLVIFLLIFGTVQYINFSQAKKKLIKKVQDVEHGGSYIDLKESLISRQESSALPFMGWLKHLGKYFVNEKTDEYTRVKLNLLRAGINNEELIPNYWGLKCFLGILLPVIFFLLRITTFKIVQPNTTMIICIILAIAGFYLPDLLLQIKIARRKNKISQGIPDALDILVVCVEAGMGLDGAMNRVADEINLNNKPLSEELKLYNLELRAGKSRPDALKNLGLRIDIEDIKNFATLLIQTDKFGTSIAQALRTYSDTFRTKRYMKAEEIAAKLPVKLMVPLIFCVFPALLVVLMGPAAVRIYHTLIKH